MPNEQLARRLPDFLQELRTQPAGETEKLGRNKMCLVHSADSRLSFPGDTVTFTSWVFNDSTVPLLNTILIPRSFTNEGLENLDYTSGPVGEELELGELGPGESVKVNFSYVVSLTDSLHRGHLISGMRVRALSADGVGSGVGSDGAGPGSGEVWGECVAMVRLGALPAFLR